MRHSNPTFEYPCPNDDCDFEAEFDIEPQYAGSFDEPPSGGWAAPNEHDNCPLCNADLTNEKYLEKVYDAWAESVEPDYS